MQEGCWPNSYLSLPLNGNHITISFWELMLEKVKNVFNHGKTLTFPKEVDTPLYKPLLITSPHYLSLFFMPFKVAASLDSIFRWLLWKGSNENGGMHLVKWGIITQPIAEGGLSLTSMKEIDAKYGRS